MNDAAPLFEAIARRDMRRVRELIGARPDLARSANADGLPVLVFARYVGEAAIVEALLAAGPPLDVFASSQIDDKDALRRLLDASPELVFAYSDDGFTALHFAAYYGAPAAMRLLLDRGANGEAVTKNFLMNMPIHAAAAAAVGRLEACETLIECGANVNARQHGGNAPLHTAGFRGDRGLAELLLRHGADASAMNDDGQTAAGIASSHGFSQLAALLRAHEGAA